MNKIKTHLREHKNAYILVGAGVAFGVLAGITCVNMRTRLSTASQFGPLAELPRSTKELPGSSFSNISGTVIANNSGPVVFGGYTKKIVQNANTGQIFDSVGQAAENAGVSFSKMSRHINGGMEHVNGDVYRIIGVSTAA